MRILISNDDGIESQGILKLAHGLRDIGLDVTVVCPHRERSTTSHSLTLHKPLRVFEVEKQIYAVTGSPADCVYFATRFLLKNNKPDLVVSGVNRGANLGHDIFYSGTVAAAREAALFGIPSIAMSLAINLKEAHAPAYWETAVEFGKALVPWFAARKFPASHVLNVNIPNVPARDIKGVRVSRQGRRVYADVVTEGVDPRGKKYYWVGGPYTGFDQIPDSDCVHVDQGFISLVPLKTDTTDYDLRTELKNWEGLQFPVSKG
ncbi:MAG TPA: 5'/3'-nucleotidase SurE [Bdellovibrionales bacterium]|nr:5'/3'-nucleotidase SurE [Bdellovibrionales bacterium]